MPQPQPQSFKYKFEYFNVEKTEKNNEYTSNLKTDSEKGGVGGIPANVCILIERKKPYHVVTVDNFKPEKIDHKYVLEGKINDELAIFKIKDTKGKVVKQYAKNIKHNPNSEQSNIIYKDTDGNNWVEQSSLPT